MRSQSDVNDDLSPHSIAGSYMTFDPELSGDTCYAPSKPQTFCFRSETYTSDYEHVLGQSLRFPEGWIVTDVRVEGAATCNEGLFGSFTWGFGDTQNEVNIYHQRQQGTMDHCVVTYCLDVMPDRADNLAEVAWKFAGDNFGNQPHSTCSTDGAYSCSQSSQPPAMIPACRWKKIATDPKARMDNVLAAYNGKVWSITGYDAKGVSYYVPGSHEWFEVSDSTPKFGDSFARSGCQVGEKVYIYGDTFTPWFKGLWSYNMATNTWTREEPAGIRPTRQGIYAPAWVADPETGMCYLTGGAKRVGGGDLDSVYVYDTIHNAWLDPLEDFEVDRNFHAAFIFNRTSDQHKLLCVVGGIDKYMQKMNSTECYDFADEEWHTPNSSIRALPEDWWGMGYAQHGTVTGDQLWLVGGVIDGQISDQTWYYDVNTNHWVNGGPLETGLVYRSGATALDGIVYHVGGSESAFKTTGVADRVYVEYYTIFPLFIRGLNE
jgi:hypothetical protein